MKKQQRFIPLKNYKGIRKDTITGKLVARKTIDKKQYSETFNKVSDAVKWRNCFHPLLTNSEIKCTKIINSKRVQSKPNGADRRYTFSDVWLLYQKQHFPTLEPQTVKSRLKFAKYFFPDLMFFKMIEINPELIDAFLEKKVEEAKVMNHGKRQNFDNDLKCLKALLNWYKENYDGLFVVPILKRHFASGIIKRVSKSNKKMDINQVKNFLNSFISDFWRDFAEIHFFMAGRVQEPSGLQWKNIDFDRGIMTVCDVAIWGNDKKFLRLKEKPKNGETRIVHINKRMLSILEKRKRDFLKSPSKFFRESTGERLDFVFHLKGEPVSYRQVQHHYNKSLKRAGLYPEFSSTHILRKAMANIARSEMGLDAAQAAGGWKSREVVEKVYTDAPNELNKQVIEHVEKMIVGGNDFDTERIGDVDTADGGNSLGVPKKFKLSLVKNEIE
jgi:integrase